MANRKTSSAQAIKDMEELNMDVSFLKGNIISIHILNIEIGIITKERAPKVIREKRPKVHKPKPQKVWRPKAPQPVRHRFNSNLTFNPDGTISLGFTSEWDYK